MKAYDFSDSYKVDRVVNILEILVEQGYEERQLMWLTLLWSLDLRIDFADSLMSIVSLAKKELDDKLV